MEKMVLKNRVYNLNTKPLVMGILNITPDSFSDGSLYFKPEDALLRAEQMARDGADIIDLGGESSRPGAVQVSLQEELDRIMPVVELLKKKLDLPLSIDTYKYAVAESAAKSGAEMINDITGLNYDPAIAGLLAEYGLAICLMHMRGMPQNMQSCTNYVDLIGEVYQQLSAASELCLSAGVNRDSIIWDPGVGFSKDTAGNLLLLKELNRFTLSGYPVLIGTSRKSFIGKVLGLEVDDRLYGTLASNVLALNNGAKIFRVHDVKPHRQALDLAWEILNS